MTTSCSPYALDPVAHAVATWGMSGVFLLSEAVVKPRLLRPTGVLEAQLDDPPLWTPDGRLAGRASRLWRRTSDLACAGALALPWMVSLSDGVTGRCQLTAGSLATDTLLMAQAYAAVNLTASVLKLATRRHRPPVCESYTPNIEYLLSFPSGHAASASCGAAFAAVAVGLRYQSLLYKTLIVGVGTLLTGLVAYGRIAGGMHYFSDVVGGALFLGSSMGFLVPWSNRAMPL